MLEKELAAQLKNRAATGFEMPEELKGKLADIGDVLEPLAKCLGGEKQRGGGRGRMSRSTADSLPPPPGGAAAVTAPNPPTSMRESSAFSDEIEVIRKDLVSIRAS